MRKIPIITHFESVIHFDMNIPLHKVGLFVERKTLCHCFPAEPALRCWKS